METIASPEMVAVPAGQVTLSDRRTRRSWHVDVASFEIAINLLTQGEYADITGERPGANAGTDCRSKACRGGMRSSSATAWSEQAGLVYGTYRFPQPDTLPETHD
jgi:formylglycine-generating enzyme required for sulfatase activity